MLTDTTQELVHGFTQGKLSRWEFVTKAVALGLSVSAVGSLLATHPEAADPTTGVKALKG